MLARHLAACAGRVLTGLLLATFPAAPVEAGVSNGKYEIITSSYLASPGFDDAVVGAGILSDGSIVLAANLGPGMTSKVGLSTRSAPRGIVARLNPDSTHVTGSASSSALYHDMAIDGGDNFYVAEGEMGLSRHNLTTGRDSLHKPVGNCTRIDAAPDGHFAAIVDGSVLIFDPQGNQIGQAKGKGYTNDVCIDGVSRTVIFCGFRNAHAFDGKQTYPVQICYVIGLNYDGSVKWTNYDWSTDRDSDRFVNKPTNNMADTRADRCAIGRDGKLYVTFQVAGGNHIFRYSPKDIVQKVDIVGGDKHHQFYNSRAEHKNFFARYDPATGDYLAGQQFCGRLSSGRANAVVTKEGDITADEDGRVYVVGVSASGIPVDVFPDESDYAGGGFLLVMSPDLKERLLCTRTCGGMGSPHVVAARRVDGKWRAVFGGGGMGDGMFTRNALQETCLDHGAGKEDPKDAFFAVVERIR